MPACSCSCRRIKMSVLLPTATEQFPGRCSTLRCLQVRPLRSTHSSREHAGSKWASRRRCFCFGPGTYATHPLPRWEAIATLRESCQALLAPPARSSLGVHPIYTVHQDCFPRSSFPAAVAIKSALLAGWQFVSKHRRKNKETLRPPTDATRPMYRLPRHIAAPTQLGQGPGCPLASLCLFVAF